LLCAHGDEYVHVIDALTGVSRHLYYNVAMDVGKIKRISDGGKLCVYGWIDGASFIVRDGDARLRPVVRSHTGTVFWVGEALYFTAIQCVTQGFSYECRTFLYKC